MFNMSEDERRDFDPNWRKQYPEFPSFHVYTRKNGWAARKNKDPHG
jgi:hypothetical protein